MARATKRQEAEATIATVEAAYDLGPTASDWFPRLLEAILPLLDHGLGAGGLIAVKAPTPGLPTIETTHVVSGPDDVIARHIASMASLPVEQTHAQTQSGVFIVSEQTANHPEMLETWRTFFDGAQDAIGLMTVDTDGRGIHILAPTPQVIALAPSARARWEMMAAHVASGMRLRNALLRQRERKTSDSELPHGAEAMINPSDFGVIEAVNDAQGNDALRTLREAAIRIDKSRAEGRLEEHTDAALAEWWALVRGRWSMVDWFDTDERRYVLALPNPPTVPNPRGLTEQEQQVTAFAALGDSHKLIAYRLGLSRSRVSHLLTSGMRKLGVKTQAQLVEKMGALAVAEYRKRSGKG
ncbi:MAG: helix-turn-helix transcriptional regulator [Myxococcales bacterium]|nr:helix-turn-helix transcriptional regulator [Deltaproteobacteria bacterium]NNL26782.1 helix-turn-helix transcriptional regulator [Myxococcales bacterium]